jgi:hypothetical protein
MRKVWQREANSGRDERDVRVEHQSQVPSVPVGQSLSQEMGQRHAAPAQDEILNSDQMKWRQPACLTDT